MTGQNKITGLRRRDAIVEHHHRITIGTGGTSAGVGGEYNTTYNIANYDSLIKYVINDGVNSAVRSKTEIESATAMLYLYVGAYTA
jgi:hypothetical protein